jgi:alkylated DNA nucleotide flippase Atl1
MQVLKLFTKQNHGAESVMVEQRSLRLQRGFGIVGDSNALVGSPRQVLIVDQPALDFVGLQPGDLWENMVLDVPVAAVRSGAVLNIGQTLIRITLPCEPCAKLETKRRGLMRQIGDQRGVLGMVVKSGEIVVGDEVALSEHRFVPLAEDTKSRFYQLVARIPAGNVVTTADLVRGLGVTNGYYRAFPALIKKAPPTLPVHRIVTIDHHLLSRYIPNQAQQLAAEGVEVVADRVKEYDRWQPENFYDLGDWT